MMLTLAYLLLAFFFSLEMCGFKMCHVVLGGMTGNLNHSVFIYLFKAFAWFHSIIISAISKQMTLHKRYISGHYPRCISNVKLLVQQTVCSSQITMCPTYCYY